MGVGMLNISHYLYEGENAHKLLMYMYEFELLENELEYPTVFDCSSHPQTLSKFKSWPSKLTRIKQSRV